jgi:hypothetical protein
MIDDPELNLGRRTYRGLSGKEYFGNQLLSIKELADAFRKHRSYVDAMKARGFSMPGGTATIDEARSFLVRNPAPKSRKLERGENLGKV